MRPDSLCTVSEDFPVAHQNGTMIIHDVALIVDFPIKNCDFLQISWDTLWLCQDNY